MKYGYLRILGKNGEVPVTSISIENSFKYYCARVKVVATSPMTGKFKLDIDGVTQEIDAVATEMSGTNYETTLFPSDFLRLHKTLIKPLKGEYTFEEICEAAGIKYLVTKETASEYWEIPQLRFCNFMDYVRDKISVMNGGGALLTFSFGGIIMCDLKSQMERDPQALLRGKLMEQSHDWSWYQQIPGNLELVQDYPDESLKREYVLNGNFAKASRTELVTNKKLEHVTEREGRNQFYRAYYQNLRYKIASDEPTAFMIGACVAMADAPKTTKGVLTETVFGTGQCVYTVSSN